MSRRDNKPILFDGIYSENTENPEKTRKAEKQQEIQKKEVEINKTEKKKVEEKPVKIKKRFSLKTFLIAFITFKVLTFILVAGVYFGLGVIYKDRIFPGVFVLGDHIGGSHDAELKKSIREKLDKTKISFQVGQKEEEATLKELGVIVESDMAAYTAGKIGRSGNLISDVRSRLLSFTYFLSPENYQKVFENQNTELAYSIKKESLNEFSKKIFEKYKTPEKNASIIIKGSDIEVLPAIYGEKIIVDSLERQVANSLDELKYGKKIVVGISKQKVMPNIKEAGLESTIRQTKAITEKKVILKFEDKFYSPAKDTIASWITFEENKKTLVPVVDQAKIENYLREIAKAIDIKALPRKIRVENGVKEIVEEEGNQGRALNIQANAAEIKKNLENSEAQINYALRVSTVEPQLIRNRVLIADWAKYVDIDLTAQRMTAYENKVPVFTDLITSGKTGWETPVGTYLVYGKTRVQTLQGGSGADYYRIPNVQWITWFNGEIAIHGAYWRSNFGTNDYVWTGSRGCINARNSSAEWIYNWAPAGTPVVVRY